MASSNANTTNNNNNNHGNPNTANNPPPQPPHLSAHYPFPPPGVGAYPPHPGWSFPPGTEGAFYPYPLPQPDPAQGGDPSNPLPPPLPPMPYGIPPFPHYFTPGAPGDYPPTTGAMRSPGGGSQRRASTGPYADGEEREPRKAAKKTDVACDFCRRRKLKCDGERPSCGQCITRELDCRYEIGPPRRRGPGKKNRALLSMSEEDREADRRAVASTNLADVASGATIHRSGAGAHAGSGAGAGAGAARTGPGKGRGGLEGPTPLYAYGPIGAFPPPPPGYAYPHVPGAAYGFTPGYPPPPPPGGRRYPPPVQSPEKTNGKKGGKKAQDAPAGGGGGGGGERERDQPNPAPEEQET
ncbi:hypothetical protein DACRYDRAFT_118435 [Dacryopinax primogenitus]|uniref:Zn(2)-C6 fungal-type domain-containing protein n=1 Tax=Dacryopinax primogenitus (strain DJM 731) TaxID=1858805 RepID=M5FPJ2_DACPD|nr:uncharacterized protein DACRYDRAFT_118435 [Dacryopinax primogenitus]EJT98605.1 hypothetical protein DACRYDRAFT_118435 [Dacryopinax primogenitus]